MNTSRKSCFILLFFLTVFSGLKAQDLSGTWEGGAGDMSLTIVLIKCGDHYVGHTYDRDDMGFCKTNFKAEFDSANKKFKGKSTGYIDHSFSHAATNYNLRYSVDGEREQLRGSGSFATLATKILSLGLPFSGVVLTKRSTATDTTQFMQAALEQLAEKTGTAVAPATRDSIAVNDDAIVDSLAIVTSRQVRTNAVLETIVTTSAAIQIKVYDNGVEDGDSISILYNDRVLQSHIPVKVTPVIFELVLDENLATHDITLVAHNLGSIPPNTATVEIKTKEKMYLISASANMNKNAVIRLRYEKPDK